MKMGSVPQTACRDARPISRPDAVNAVRTAQQHRAADLARRLASMKK